MRQFRLVSRLASGWKRCLRCWIARHFPKLSKRERAALIVLLVPVLAGGVLALVDSSSGVVLAIDKSTPTKAMTLTADAGNGSGLIQARTRVLAFHGVVPSVPRSSDVNRPDVVKLALPISKAACAQLIANIGGSCDTADKAVPQAAAPLTIEWPSGGKVNIRAPSASLVSAAPTPVSGAARDNAWNFQFDAPVTTVEFECPQEALFTLVFKGHPLPQRCEPGRATHHLTLTLDSRLIPELFLTGLGPSHFEAAGRKATLSVDRGLLLVGDSEHMLRGGQIPVKIGSEQPHEVRADIDNRETGNRFEVTFSTPSADEIEVSGDSMLHSALSSYMDYWLLILGMVGGVLLSVFLERVPARD